MNNSSRSASIVDLVPNLVQRDTVVASQDQGSMTLVNRLARKAVLARLARLERGSLQVSERYAGQEVVHQFGESADVAQQCAHIIVTDPAAFREVARNGVIGSGEAYMAGYWHSPDLVSVIRLMVSNLPMLERMNQNGSLVQRGIGVIAHAMNRNSVTGSRRNIAAHYDLGNEFFDLFLDPTMLYSAAIFPSEDATLEQASVHKLDTICRKLRLSPDDHLLEIGTGWGGLAVHAARHYGCKVTTTTISREQYEYAKQWVIREGLEDRVELLLKDYRELEGAYDKIVSIEMVEAVGHRYHSEFFRRCGQLLKPHGLMLMQAITIPDQRYDAYRQRVDFIQRYIFPGGCLPSVEVVAGHIARQTDLQITDLHDITRDYARTLACWREAFHQRLDAVRGQGFDQGFIRMWDFYLAYCEGGFRERAIGTVQFLFAGPDARDVSVA